MSFFLSRVFVLFVPFVVFYFVPNVCFFCPVCVFFVPTTGCLFCPVFVFFVPLRFFVPVPQTHNYIPTCPLTKFSELLEPRSEVSNTVQTVHHSAAHHTHSVLYDSPSRAHHMYTADCQQPLSLRSCLNSNTLGVAEGQKANDEARQREAFHNIPGQHRHQDSL